MNNHKYRIEPLFIVEMIIAIISTSVCLYCNLGSGYELIGLLPLSFFVSRLFFNRAYTYKSSNLAFIVLFFSIYARYIATPVLMSISQSTLGTVFPTPTYLRVAVIVQIIELFVVLFLVDMVWTKNLKTEKYTQVQNKKPEVASIFRLSLIGFCFLAGLVVLVFARGHMDNVLSHVSTWWYISEDFSDLYTYDLMALVLVKNVLGIWLISLLSKRYQKSKYKSNRNILFIIALLIGLSMTMAYQFTARTALAQLILSVMMVLAASFPDKKKIVYFVFGVGGIIFVSYIFSAGSMNETASQNTDKNFLELLADMGQLYVTGPDMVAITLQNTDSVRALMTPMTLLSDIINTTHIFGMIPGLRGITSFVSGVPTSNQLFVDSLNGLTYILPNCSFWVYYGGIIFGGVLEILSIFVSLKAICWVESKKYFMNDTCFVFVISYVEILLGQVFFVNNSFLLWHAFTFEPLWLLIFIFINKLFKWKKTKPEHKE